MAARAFMTFLCVAATGCAPVEEPVQVAAPVGDEDSCNASGAASLIGRPASAELEATALKLSGAGVVRWIRPGEGVTSDYQTNRLNIDVDAQNRIRGFSCG